MRELFQAEAGHTEQETPSASLSPEAKEQIKKALESAKS
jgi:hypothetical protein